jgi:large subunit ribosomal protein L35
VALQSTWNARVAFHGVAILFKDILMPKIKTHKGAAKRFKFTAKGKIRRNRAYAGHLFLSKSAKQKRRLRQSTYVDPSNEKRLKRLIHR